MRRDGKFRSRGRQISEAQLTPGTSVRYEAILCAEFANGDSPHLGCGLKKHRSNSGADCAETQLAREPHRAGAARYLQVRKPGNFTESQACRGLCEGRQVLFV